MTTTSKLALELLANAAANQTLANTTFAQLNQLVQAGVIDKDLATPPGSPADESLYIVAASPTGAWVGKTGQLSYWLTSTAAWQFIVPREGMLVHVNDEDKFYKYNGSVWEVLATGGTSLAAVQTFTGNKTLALSDINTYNVSQDAAAQTVTLPAQATVAWTADAEVHIEQGGTGTVTVTGATGVTVNGVSAGSFDLAGQFSVVTLKRIASNSWTLLGGLAHALVSGPASSGDGNIALFDGTTGKLIKDGGVVTASGLALLDDASTAAQRITLELGSAATRTALGTTGELYSRDSILGAVSQSAGVPTGAIIERGSNANGEYVRYADGTQICTFVFGSLAYSISTAYLGGFRGSGVTWTFPAAFAAKPVVEATAENLSGFGCGLGTPTSTAAVLFWFAVTSQAGADRLSDVVAVGRWF